MGFVLDTLLYFVCPDTLRQSRLAKKRRKEKKKEIDGDCKAQSRDLIMRKIAQDHPKKTPERKRKKERTPPPQKKTKNQGTQDRSVGRCVVEVWGSRRGG